MKKSIKNVIISLALSAMAFCCMGGLLPFMNKTDAAATTVYKTFDGLVMNEKAAIRSIEPNGIRFTTDITVDKQNEIKGLISNPQYGTLLLPADMLGTEELTHETKDVVDSVAKIWWDKDSYTSVLMGGYNTDGTPINLPESYYNRPIAARSYVKGTDTNGNTVIYYSETTAIRSIGYVAYMAQADNDNRPLIADIVEKTEIKLVFTDERISAHQNTATGTTVVENTIAPSTSAAATVTVGGIPVPADMVDEIEYTSSKTDVISVSGETLTAEQEGSATITASVTFGGKELTASKEMSTDCYEAESVYKILISEDAAAAQLNANTSYLPAQSAEDYNAYSLAYEKTAAYKLQSVLAEVTGIEFPIVTTTGETGVKYISVGETTLANGVSVNDLSDTEARVQVIDGNVIIRGGGREGTLYGVQRWLYDVVGYEYYMNNTYAVNDKVEIVALSEAKTYMRDIDYNVTQPEKLDYHAGSDALDGYGMRSYTEKIIPLGTTDYEDENGWGYLGISHNSLAVFDQELSVDESTGSKSIMVDSSSEKLTTYSVVEHDGNDVTTTLYDKDGVLDSSEYALWYATKSIPVTEYEVSASFFGVTTYKATGNTVNLQVHMPYPNNSPYYKEGAKEDDPDRCGDQTLQRIKGELCYTAHGNNTEKAKMVEFVASAMFAKMQKFPLYDKIGFAQMDHTIWCECSACSAHGNPSANLLEFLLDVAASLKTKLTEAGDNRAGTFNICTLFYHKTNPNPTWETAEPTEKLTNYMKHIEVWFAETGADQIDPYNLEYSNTTASVIATNNGGNDWNTKVYGFMSEWSNLCKTHGADMLWWGYYANTTSQFIPFNTIDAMRYNYKTASELGVDTMFNQMMTFQTNWSSLKYYLMSKLTVNAKPTDDEWNGWIDSYFAGSYGPGAADMRAYYNSWYKVTNDNKDLYRREKTYEAYQENSNVSKAAMGLEARGFDISVQYDNSNKVYNGSIAWNTTWDDVWSETTLKAWIDSCDAALAALDATDSKYETYYRNIMLEKLVPMYLLMVKYDKYTFKLKAMNNVGYFVLDYSQTGEFETDDYVKQYGAEFLTWVNELKITHDGEGRKLDPILDAIKAKDQAAYTTTVVSDLVVAEKGKSVTLSSAALAAGDYTVSGTLTEATSATVSTAGEVTITVGNVAVGDIYSVTFTNESTKSSVTFNNVMVASEVLAENAGAVGGSNGYYVIDKTYYIEEGTTDTWLMHDVLQKGTYTVTVNGNSTESTVYYAGRLKVTLHNMNNGTKCNVIVVDSKSNAYVFNVIGATFIRTVEELQALGVGGGVETTGDLRDFGGRGNSFTAGNDVTGYYVLANDIDAAGYYFAAGYFGYQSYFRGTFDGNGHTIYNVVVSEGGIFGGMQNATIRNVNFANVAYHGNESGLPNGGRGYNENTQWGQYFGLLGQIANEIIVENINVQVSEIKTSGKLPFGLLVFRPYENSTNIFRNINIDASGLALDNVLTTHTNDGTILYNNVTIKADSYKSIARVEEQIADGAITEWPAGVTFTEVTENPNTYVIWHDSAAYVSNTEILPVYTGDVTTLGFKEGTLVQYAVQDNRTNMWAAGTNLGLTMEKQGVRLVKALNEEYASIQFSISREFTGAFAFFTWWYNAESVNQGGGGYLKTDGTYDGGSLNAVAFDLETGEIATNFVPDKAYELRWYAKDAIIIKLGCCEQNGESITVYYANPSSGNENILDDRVTVEIDQSVTTTETTIDKVTTATATFTATGTTTLDVSDVTNIVGSESVTMWLNGNIIYEGTLGDTLTLDASLFANSGNNSILIRYDGGCVHLPIYVSNTIELNQDNAGSVYKLQAILAAQPNSSYVLTSNLDMGGKALKAIETFGGVLDGNGYVITNTSLAFGANPSIAGNSYAPLFIVTNNGTLKDIGFELSDYVWNQGSQERGITVNNYGTISNVYVTITLKTALNAGDGYTPTNGADVTKYNAIGVLGRRNYGTVENSIVRVTSEVELSNYCVAALFYINASAGSINNSYVITDVAVIEPIWMQDGASTNVTKCVDWPLVNTGAMTSGNGWSDVWSVDEDDCVYFGSTLLYDPMATTPTISATDKPDEFSVYSGDASALGFTTTSTVYQAQVSNGWSSRVKITTDNVNADYVSFDFVVSSQIASIVVWPSCSGSYAINSAGVNINQAPADVRTIAIYDANGNDVTKGPWAANTAYTMVVCLKGAEYTIDSFQICSFNAPGSFYFTNLKSGYLPDLGVIEIDTGEFDLPATVVGTVKSITFAETNVLESVSGSTVVLNQSAMPTNGADLGHNKLLNVITDKGSYLFNATVVTKVIMTAEDIFDLGVGGKSGTGLKQNSDVANNDVVGYYLVGQDIDCGGKLFAAGYSYQKSYFKGVFDGNGKTISNFLFGAGGLFGGMLNATVKNVNFEDVTMNGASNDDGFWSNYTALFAHYAYGSTFEDINVEIVNIKTAKFNFPVQDGLFVEGYKGYCTFRNIVVDATDLTVENALGTSIGSSTNLTFENVTIYAGDVTRIGYVGTEQISVAGTDTDGDGLDDATGNALDGGKYKTEGEYLTEWPAGVTVVKKVTNTALQYKKGGNVLVYNGDETDLGFAEGTTVYHYTAPAATSSDIWTVMGANGIKLTKATYEDYASVQFVLGRNFADENTSAGAFFSWIHALPDNATGLVYAAGGWLYRNGRTVASNDANFSASQNGFSLVVYDADGNLVTDANPLVTGTVYTLYVYCDYLVDIELCVYETNGSTMDVYFANPSSGKGKLLYGTNEAGALPIYTGDVTKLGFEEGTTVQYKADEYDLVGGAGNWWQSGTAVEINGQILDCSTNVKRQSAQPVVYANADYDVVCVQFALSEAIASGNVFHVWAYDDSNPEVHLGGGAVCIGQTWAESGFAGAIYDKDGNIATSLEANTVYVLKLRMDGAYRYNFANIAESAMTTYYSSTISYENEAE